MPDWKAYVVQRFGADGLEEDVIEEVTQHAEEMYRAGITAGRTRAESRSAVEAELDDLPAVVREARARRPRPIPAAPDSAASGRLSRMDSFLRDVAHGARLMLASPAFSLVAVLTLAIAIGANTVVFSVAHAMLFEGLPFPAADRLVMLWEADAEDPSALSIVAAPNYEDWTRLSTSFESLGIWEHQTFNLGGPEPEQVSGLRASSSLFTVFGVPPQLGRTFTLDEDRPGHDVAIVSHRLWRRRFGEDPTVLNQTIRMNGRPFRIIGVMPEHFRTHQRDEVWIPIQFSERDAGRDSHSFYVAARLRADVDFATAKAEMLTIGRQLASAYEENAGEVATVTRMNELGVAHLRGTLLMLLAAVLLVLLIACVNVANLLLVRAATRQREFAIRTALGAGRARLALQLLAEGLLLALIGGAAGLLLAWGGTTAVAGALPPSIRFAPFRSGAAVSLAPAVVVFTFVAATLAGILFSLAPIVGVWRVSPDAVLRAGGDRGGTARQTWLRHSLVASEIALAVVLLVSAGLTIKSITRVIAVDPGLDTTNVLTMTIALPQPDFYGAPERPHFCDDVATQVGSVPGVIAAGAISHLPLSGANASRGFAIEGRPDPPPGQGAGASYRVTCPGYFETLGIPIVAGRDFSSDDTLRAPMVVMVNESTAAKYWPDESPLGNRIKFGLLSSDTPWLTIVGVVKDVRHFGLDADVSREIYRPYSQVVWPLMTVTAKTAAEPLTMASAVRSALRRIDSDQPVSNVRSMEQVLEESLGARRFPVQLLSSFSAIAFALAAIGVYGVVGYVVSLRTREIGIRMALGARRGSVVRLMIARSLVPVSMGMAAGLAGALVSGRFLEAFLFQVRPADPSVLGTIAALLGSTAAVASWLPARRAARVDPSTVLREE